MGNIFSHAKAADFPGSASTFPRADVGSEKAASDDEDIRLFNLSQVWKTLHIDLGICLRYLDTYYSCCIFDVIFFIAEVTKRSPHSFDKTLYSVKEIGTLLSCQFHSF